MRARSNIFFLFFIMGLLFSMTSGDLHAKSDIKPIQSKTMENITDKPLADYQQKLLELAFDAATIIPIKPHIKDRSRAQEKVVEATLKLGQPRRADTYINKIDNWRRGIGYAHMAFYLAQKDHNVEAEYYLNLADQVAIVAEDWRRDRIKSRIAQTYVLLGNNEEADNYSAGLESAETGKMDQVKMMRFDEETFNDHIVSLDALVSRGDVDITRNVLMAYAELFNRFYHNKKYRSLSEEKIRTSWTKIPWFIRVEVLMDLSRYAMENDDQARALEIINEAQEFVETAYWRLEHRIAFMARLIKLRHSAGDQEKAQKDAAAMLKLFMEEGATIVNIYRAEALCPLAEAYQAMGDKETALKVYKMAIKESLENPNSRPRAEDLSLTYFSMALHEVEPDAELWGRIRQVNQELKSPW